MNKSRLTELFMLAKNHSCGPNQIMIIHIVSVTITIVSGCFTEVQGLTQQAKVTKSPL